MPYSEPTIHTNYRYNLRVDHTPSGATLYAEVENDGTEEGDMDSALQALVDLLDATPGWSLISAGKGYEGGSACTPTPNA